MGRRLSPYWVTNKIWRGLYQPSEVSVQKLTTRIIIVIAPALSLLGKISSKHLVQGFQWKPVTSGLPPPVGPLTAICLDFINENKNDINEKSLLNNNNDFEILNATKNNKHFDAQNAGNHISKLLDFKFFWESMPQTPLEEKGLTAHSVVTAVYYTFKDRLELKLLKPC